MRCNNSLAVKKCGVVSLDLGDGVRSLAPDVQRLRRRRTACIQRPVSHGQNCRASLESRARFQQRLQGARRPKLRREMSTGPSKFWRLAPTRQRCLLREMHHAQRTRKIVPSSKCAILVSVQPCLSKTCIETALSLEKYTKQWTLPSSMALATACSWSN